jgi:Spy/CpxP family protein refolding chaperone
LQNHFFINFTKRKHLKRNKMVIAAVTLALMLTIGAGASMGKGGFGRGFGPPGHLGPPMMRCIKQLNLAAETRNSIDALVQANRESMKDNFATTRTLMDSYLKVLTTSPLDETALASAKQALLAQRQAEMESHFELDRAIVKLLNADELAALATCLSNNSKPAGSTSTVNAEQ